MTDEQIYVRVPCPRCRNKMPVSAADVCGECSGHPPTAIPFPLDLVLHVMGGGELALHECNGVTAYALT